MKKKLALLMSALMVVTAIPATAFAVTTNTVSKVVSGTIDSTTSANAPVFTIEDKSLEDITTAETIAFKATLNNAEWDTSASALNATVGGSAVAITGSAATDNTGAQTDNVQITLLSSTQAIIEVPNFKADANAGAYIKFPIMAELTDEGEATMDIDPMDTVITGGTYKFANVVEGAATVSINDTTPIKEGTTEIETITIEEVTAGSLEDGELKLKLNSDFEWKTAPTVKVYPTSAVSIAPGVIDGETVTYTVSGTPSSKTATITLVGGEITADFDDIEVGEICEVTVSGAGVDKTTLEVGTATDYNVSLSAENKTVPTFYSGRATDEEETLKVTIKENIANSWIVGRKATLTFPEGVKVKDVDVTKAENATGTTVKIKDNEVEFDVTKSGSATSKMKFEMTFDLSISPRFEGDIVAKLSGAAIGEDQEVVVGVAKAPITVEAETNKVSIDYRNVAIGDIIIKEAYAGALEKGKTLSLQLNTIAFDGDPTVEVVEGDLTIDEVEVDGGKINIKIDSESAKTPATLKVTNIELFLDRTLPAGNYALKLVANSTYDTTDGDGNGSASTNENELEASQSFGKINGRINNDQMINNKTVGDAYFQNSVTDKDDYDETVLFDIRNKTVLDNYVEVVTAGRDQDDSTFTTQIKVTIGANTMIVGDEEKALDVPAYISNGYTMMPVRAVTEALSGKAIVRWDDATKTVTITFGSRVISMTVGSSSMLINGVPVQMQAAVEITGSRAFIPLRDLGYALGLNDTKIGWDDATKTATLN